MQTLIPFSSSAVSLRATAVKQGSSLIFNFALRDPDNHVRDSLREGRWSSWGRADELWKTTCFEAFFGIPRQPAYWELNLSPSKRAWNLYKFDSYRNPQPPRTSHDFELREIVATSDTLACILKIPVEIEKLELSLNAVIRTRSSPEYFALKHAGAKPDFHLRESFALKL
jgi:hypothetical protein